MQLSLQLLGEKLSPRICDARSLAVRRDLRLALGTRLRLGRRQPDKIRCDQIRSSLHTNPPKTEFQNLLFHKDHIILRLPQGLLRHIDLLLVHTANVSRYWDLSPPDGYTVARMRRKIHEDNNNLGRVIECNRFLQGLVHGVLKHVKVQPIENRLVGVVGQTKRRVCKESTTLTSFQEFGKLK